MNSSIFEPKFTSTPKRTNSIDDMSNFCSTPRPVHVRWSLSKYSPRPVDSSTPNMKKSKRFAKPSLQRLIYPLSITAKEQMRVWVL